MLTARDIMSMGVVQLERGTSVHEAASTMTQHGVGSLIVTAGSYPVGIVTETDIVRVMARGQDPAAVHIEDVMSSPLFSTSPETDVVQIANTMTSNRIKKMPVIERQRVIGIITQTDIVKYALHTISELEQAFASGKLSAQDFASRSQDIFLSVPQIANATKQWHMKCKQCSFRFMAEEKNGQLSIAQCPRCSGAIDYDPTPPL